MIKIKKIAKEYSLLMINGIYINLYNEENYARIDYELSNDESQYTGSVFCSKEELKDWAEDDNTLWQILINKLNLEIDRSFPE